MIIVAFFRLLYRRRHLKALVSKVPPYLDLAFPRSMISLVHPLLCLCNSKLPRPVHKQRCRWGQGGVLYSHSSVFSFWSFQIDINIHASFSHSDVPRGLVVHGWLRGESFIDRWKSYRLRSQDICLNFYSLGLYFFLYTSSNLTSLVFT